MSTEEPLFRHEVLAHRQSQGLGTVLLVPKRVHTLFSLFAMLTLAAVLGLLFFATFTRTERVKGWLVPTVGLVRVVAPQQGVVSLLRAGEGDQVHKGDVLLNVSSDLQSAMGATQHEVARQLQRRRDSLAEEIRLETTLFQQRQSQYQVRLAAIDRELKDLAGESALQKHRLQLARSNEQRRQTLFKGRFVPEQSVHDAMADRLDQALKLGNLERMHDTLNREALVVEGELRNLPVEHQARLADIQRRMAAVDEERVQAEARREIAVTAPVDGTVTALQTEVGGYVNPNKPLLQLVPDHAVLEAQLFCPSRAIGFLRTGQSVLLRYQAFPYQKFGHYHGVVTRVTRSAINPSEFSAALTGIADAVGAKDVMYLIGVRLDKQVATAYGEPVPLQSGMQLEADIQIESRRLFEWVLDPLYTLTGKWQS